MKSGFLLFKIYICYNVKAKSLEVFIMARLTRTQKYAELRDQLANDREESKSTSQLAEFENKLKRIEDTLTPKKEEPVVEPEPVKEEEPKKEEPVAEEPKEEVPVETPAEEESAKEDARQEGNEPTKEEPKEEPKEEVEPIDEDEPKPTLSIKDYMKLHHIERTQCPEPSFTIDRDKLREYGFDGAIASLSAYERSVPEGIDSANAKVKFKYYTREGVKFCANGVRISGKFYGFTDYHILESAIKNGYDIDFCYPDDEYNFDIIIPYDKLKNIKDWNLPIEGLKYLKGGYIKQAYHDYMFIDGVLLGGDKLFFEGKDVAGVHSTVSEEDYGFGVVTPDRVGVEVVWLDPNGEEHRTIGSLTELVHWYLDREAHKELPRSYS